MNIKHCLILLMCLCGMGQLTARAASLEAVGVIGNSGVEGKQLVRCDPRMTDAPGGVCVDADLTVWLSGGDRINHTTLDGQLIESFPLGEAWDHVESRSFTALGGKLYFFALSRTPAQLSLVAFPIHKGATVERVKSFEPCPPNRSPVMAAEAIGEELLLGRLDPASEPGDLGTVQVYFLNPRTGVTRPFASWRGAAIGGIAVDSARERIYVGVNLGKIMSANTHHKTPSEMLVLDQSGKELERRDCVNMEAIPSAFNGWLSYAGGAVWDTAWYGFVARFDEGLQNNPGKVTGWNLELNRTAQVVGLQQATSNALLPPAQTAKGYDPLLLSSCTAGTAHFARWNRESQRLELVQRIGCLPRIDSLAISPDGLIGVGTGTPNVQLWWHWDDGAGTPASSGAVGGAVRPGAFHKGRMAGLSPDRYAKTPQWHGARYSPGTGLWQYRAEPAVMPMKDPGGLAAIVESKFIGTTTRDIGTAYVTDRDTGTLWRGNMNMFNWWPEAASWKQVPIEGELHSPGDICVLEGGRIAIADGPSVVILEPVKDGFRILNVIARISDKPSGLFGPELRLAAERHDLVVADTQRHRLVLLDALAGTALAQVGQTDKTGAGLDSLDSPGPVAISQGRVVVADQGNQRVVKYVVRP